MRVTNRMLANNFLTDMTTNLNNLQTLQQQLTSGKEIRRPSDDPLKVARAMQLHSEIGANKQYNENIKDTLSWLEQTDTALGQLGDQTHRIRELLVSAGNVAYGTDERKKINDEIKEIIGQMSQTLNASFDGRFIFGGTRGTAKPVNVINNKLVYADRFGNEMTDVVEVTKASEWQGKDIVFNYTDATGSKEITIKLDTIDVTKGMDDLVDNINGEIGKSIDLKDKLKAEVVEVNGKSYIEFTSKDKDGDKKVDIRIGDSTTVPDMEGMKGVKVLSSEEKKIMSEKLVTEISQGVRVEYNITAVDVIKFNDGKDDRDLRIILEDIVTHLESDDAEDVKKITNEDLAALDAVMDNILKLRSQVGAKGNRMESALEKNKEENFNLTEILSKTEDIDLTEKTMEYAVAISVYMASLQTSARVLQPTLMDYVR
ncbi:flagellar hook-associated protein FlgL [Clostridium cochlearium]|uniref:flagellar hook-associated protein FlgL n=1 Tax=Clostridium cochlearium TaxID=1494 RepID=UPI001EDEDD19|nr:flagellar hook-associated protein FlgL [Clostridium cochlearium]MCG4571613.1 flagellar hook-associated protein FlgL [Clostridium cochlearium]MCG4581221.1 flagellar hook-associated protein FlgL [Clostridium cochlearium]